MIRRYCRIIGVCFSRARPVSAAVEIAVFCMGGEKASQSGILVGRGDLGKGGRW